MRSKLQVLSTRSVEGFGVVRVESGVRTPEVPVWNLFDLVHEFRRPRGRDPPSEGSLKVYGQDGRFQVIELIIPREATMSRKRQACARNAERNDANSDAPKRSTIPFRVVDLREHPLQSRFFSGLPYAEFKELLEDIRKNGIRHPPEVLCDGTILRGHQRVRAARELGWTTIDAVVRDDLDPADEVTIEAMLIDDNLYRRQLSPVQQGSCAVRMAEIEADRRGYTDFWQRGPFIKKVVQARLQCSSRNATRHIALAKSGRPLREAVDRGLLPLAWAERIAALPEELLVRLTTEIEKLMIEPEGDGRTSKNEARKLAEEAFEAAVRQRPDRRRRARAIASAKVLMKGIQQLQIKCDALLAELDGVLRDWGCPPDWLSATSHSIFLMAAKEEQAVVTSELQGLKKKIGKLLQRVQAFDNKPSASDLHDKCIG